MHGYLNTVLRRTGKTLLVEGVTDHSVMTRLKRSRAAKLGSEPDGHIDIVELVQDPSTSGLGKKEVIKTVLREIQQLPPFLQARVIAKLGVLMDREWDDIEVELQLLTPWSAPTQVKPYFVTLGHSVENYFFRLDGIESYLRQQFFLELEQPFFNNLKTRFNQIIAFAATYSLAMRREHWITRGSGLISLEHVEWVGGRYIARGDLSAALMARNLQVPEDFLENININIGTYLEQYHTPEPGRWLCHGHLGEEAIWACVANLVAEHLPTNRIAKDIERGHKDLRFNHALDFMTRETLEDCIPLEHAILWLTAEAA